jgi:hypothetical protein
MKAALQEYYREVEEKAERFAKANEMRERADHLRAFNLGRMAQRVEGVKFHSWLRVGWLLAGLAIGVAIGRAVPGSWFPAGAQRYFAAAGHIAAEAGRSAAHWMLH